MAVKTVHAPATQQVAEAPEAEKVKKERPKLVGWGDRDAEGALKTRITWTQGQAKPEGYNTSLHLPLKRADFATAADFYEYQADQHERKGVEMRQMAADERSGVGKTTKAKQKKLLKLKSSMDALMAELEAAGVDVKAAMAGK